MWVLNVCPISKSYAYICNVWIGCGHGAKCYGSEGFGIYIKYENYTKYGTCQKPSMIL